MSEREKRFRAYSVANELATMLNSGGDPDDCVGIAADLHYLVYDWWLECNRDDEVTMGHVDAPQSGIDAGVHEVRAQPYAVEPQSDDQGKSITLRIYLGDR